MAIVYRCDPEKNSECKKTTCKHNPDAADQVCEYTTKKEFSTDGIALVFPTD